MGPFLTFHLGAQRQGIRAYLHNLGGAHMELWKGLGRTEICLAALVDTIAAGVDRETVGAPVEKFLLRRDRALVALNETSAINKRKVATLDLRIRPHDTEHYEGKHTYDCCSGLRQCRRAASNSLQSAAGCRSRFRCGASQRAARGNLSSIPAEGLCLRTGNARVMSSRYCLYLNAGPDPPSPYQICAAAGAHVLCEKPMAVTLEDANAMAEICVRADVRFFYGSSYRYLPAVQEAKSLITAGAIGTVRLVIEEALGGDGADAYRALSSDHYPVGGPGGGGYGLVDHGIHMLDVFPWLCDSTIIAVFGRGDRTGNAPRPEVAMLEMRNGSTGVLIYDGSTRPATAPSAGVFSEARRWIAGRGWMGEAGEWETDSGNIRIYGTAGSLHVFHYANKLFINRTGRPQEQRLPAGTPLIISPRK